MSNRTNRPLLQSAWGNPTVPPHGRLGRSFGSLVWLGLLSAESLGFLQHLAARGELQPDARLEAQLVLDEAT